MSGDVPEHFFTSLAQRVAEFHRRGDRNARIAAFGRFDVVARNARENFTQTEPHIEVAVERGVHGRVRELTEQHLERHRPLIEARAERGVPCDTHGDLRLEHVYLFPDEAPPNDLVIIDCIEFAERFRFADPIADMAFLTMDLAFHGRRDLARLFGDAYFHAAADPDGAALLPLYIAYRAVVRAKVDGMELVESEIDPVERTAALTRARAHWLLALGYLESPSARPVLVMLAGLPGTGKSTLARGLAARANFHLLRSDVIRKELAGATDSGKPALAHGIYAPMWDDRTYEEMLRRAESHWWRGERVLVDASFREDARREQFLRSAVNWGVPAVLLHCQARPDVVRQRLQARRGDASDADWSVHQALVEAWQPFSAYSKRFVHLVETSGSPEEAEERAMGLLEQMGST
jgi:predicted kinase